MVHRTLDKHDIIVGCHHLHIFINKIYCKCNFYQAKCKQPSDWLSGISNYKLAWNWTVNILWTLWHDKYNLHIFINKIYCKCNFYQAKCKQPSDWLSGISNYKLAWNWTVNILWTYNGTINTINIWILDILWHFVVIINNIPNWTLNSPGVPSYGGVRTWVEGSHSIQDWLL